MSKTNPNILFTYGELSLAQALPRFHFICDAYAPACLYTDGTYPTALETGHSLLYGKLWTPHRSYSFHAMRYLDRWRGAEADPAVRLYERDVIRVLPMDDNSSHHELIYAWYYRWNGSLETFHPAQCDSWSKWIERAS